MNDQIKRAILGLLPADGSAIGNVRCRGLVSQGLSVEVPKDDYNRARDLLIVEGEIKRGAGRGGSIKRPTLTPTRPVQHPRPVPTYERRLSQYLRDFDELDIPEGPSFATIYAARDLYFFVVLDELTAARKASMADRAKRAADEGGSK